MQNGQENCASEIQNTTFASKN